MGVGSTKELIEAQKAAVSFYETIATELRHELNRVKTDRDDCYARVRQMRNLPMLGNLADIDFPKLAKALDEHFDGNELDELIYDLGDVSWRNLPGATNKEKARQIVNYYIRRERVGDLVKKAIEMRPHVPWLEKIQKT